jgi:hypothetical protein
LLIFRKFFTSSRCCIFMSFQPQFIVHQKTRAGLGPAPTARSLVHCKSGDKGRALALRVRCRSAAA